MQSIFDLRGRTAVVTGGGVGLGYGIAKGLARAGADLILVSHNVHKESLQKLKDLGVKAAFIQADLKDLDGIESVVGQCLEAAGGQVDILVNNSGIIRRTPAADHPLPDWHEVLQLNLHAVFYLCQSFGKRMIERGSGKIINIASMLSFQGGINVPGYTAAKHGVAGITKALANEWAKHGVNVNAIAPGYMATDNTQQLRDDPKRSAEILCRIPAGRWGTPGDLAGPAVFLASSASDYVNGHILCVDGGWMNR
ncbi:3-ketoacyl-ACP reductase [Paenibacillus dendritiformis]|uniref:2-dehydro-3-deoxy-D-gluconate 5-dehydrogenase KduD n=1 Tax=Paenibacillus dendritiformis TaxID=130049 RepID=UPI0018CF75F0|nr:2-dehydro-3-deoxy-D-gluconate 5-dehydrogenase KduD [Paenibacillus dendritiformis]MBG9795742.1 3-ketoacyl-ACP reductase [Paenibacillus dendritiformis]